MSVLIKNTRHRNRIEFDRGFFDWWCVYLSRPAQPRYAPRDIEYFTTLKNLAAVHGSKKLYTDFVLFYHSTNQYINYNLLSHITHLSNSYGRDAEEIDVWFTVIYAGMVAEENKLHAKLKKRIKRLGMHQLLVEDKEPEYAAEFSKGKTWRELDMIMKRKGF